MISIILPIYNEEKNIIFVINDILKFCRNKNLSFEIIAVNDGSIDKTKNILENFKIKEDVVVVHHKKNLGYGAALRDGFNLAKGDLIFFTDSDRQFDIRDINLFLEKIDKKDFIVGYRKKRSDNFIRIINASIFRFVARILFGVKVKDVDCAFKLFKSYVLKDNLFSNGALINLEILAKAKKRNYRFIELPVNHFERKEGVSTGGNFRVIFEAIINLLKLWTQINLSK
jgi:glycosyltransferase involved in cell wall biosynthesis